MLFVRPWWISAAHERHVKCFSVQTCHSTVDTHALFHAHGTCMMATRSRGARTCTVEHEDRLLPSWVIDGFESNEQTSLLVSARRSPLGRSLVVGAAGAAGCDVAIADWRSLPAGALMVWLGPVCHSEWAFSLFTKLLIT